MIADAAHGSVYMDALITPNRSLSRRGFAAMLGVLVVYNLLVMAFLVLIGAFPVPIFLGLDFVGLLVAFRVNNRRAGAGERVHVTAERVQVSRRAPAGEERTVWASPTAFTRVAVERASEHDAQVKLRLSNRAMQVGAQLSQDERVSFAAALERAIRAARAERYSGSAL